MGIAEELNVRDTVISAGVVGQFVFHCDAILSVYWFAPHIVADGSRKRKFVDYKKKGTAKIFTLVVSVPFGQPCQIDAIYQ